MVATSGPGSESRWNSAQAPLAFVGRAAELAELVGGLPNTNLHGRRLWLVSGEAGIGKTRLVRELTAVANASGSEVAWGQCWDGSGTPPFWPWTQIIRRLRGLDSNADLRQLVLGDDVSDADAFTLYDAVASQLRASARERPTLVVLDDIHRADVGTLQLTRFVAEHLVDAPIQVVVTLRPPASLDRCVNTRYLDHLAEVGRRSTRSRGGPCRIGPGRHRTGPRAARGGRQHS